MTSLRKRQQDRHRCGQILTDGTRTLAEYCTATANSTLNSNNKHILPKRHRNLGTGDEFGSGPVGLGPWGEYDTRPRCGKNVLRWPICRGERAHSGASAQRFLCLVFCQWNLVPLPNTIVVETAIFFVCRNKASPRPNSDRHKSPVSATRSTRCGWSQYGDLFAST